MKYEGVLTGVKWDVLSELSKGQRDPQSLAKIMKSSLTNVLQQLAILEAHGLIKREKDKTRKPGKPKTIYSLNKELLHTTWLQKGIAKKRIHGFKNQDMISTILLNQVRTRLFDNGEDAYFLTKFMMMHENLIRKCDAIAFLETSGTDIELLVISDAVGEIREKISNQIMIGPKKKERKIVVWSHTKAEFKQGLQSKDKYFTDFKKAYDPLYDPGNFFSVLE